MNTMLQRLSRVTTSGKFISEIDGLRFIAIGTVVLFHLAVNLQIKAPLGYPMPAEGNLLAAVARHGFRGVELFFIISGFILGFPFAGHFLLGRKKVRLGEYFLRRVTRLEPPYFLCMVLLFLISGAVGRTTLADAAPHLAASLVYMHNLVFGGENIINNVAWSLEIEIQFYLLVPVLSLVFAIRRKSIRRATIVGIGLTTVMAEWLWIDESSPLYLTIVRFLHFFLVGFLLADVYLVDWKEHPSRAWRWDLLSVAGWPLLFALWNSPEISRVLVPGGTLPLLPAVLFPVLAFTLYMAAFRGPITNRILTNAWVTTIGGMCYTIYLFHNQLIGFLTGITSQVVPTNAYTVNVLIQMTMVIPPMLAACALYFALVERPCMRKDWPRRLTEWVRVRVHGNRNVETSV